MDSLHTDTVTLIITHVLIPDMRDLRAFAVNHKIHALAETVWLQLARSSLRTDPLTQTLAGAIDALHPKTVVQHIIDRGGIDVQLLLYTNTIHRYDRQNSDFAPFILRVGTLAGSMLYIDTYRYSIEYIVIRGKYLQSRLLYRYPRSIGLARYKNDDTTASPRSMTLRHGLETLVRKILPEVAEYVFPM